MLRTRSATTRTAMLAVVAILSSLVIPSCAPTLKQMPVSDSAVDTAS